MEVEFKAKAVQPRESGHLWMISLIWVLFVASALRGAVFYAGDADVLHFVPATRILLVGFAYAVYWRWSDWLCAPSRVTQASDRAS